MFACVQHQSAQHVRRSRDRGVRGDRAFREKGCKGCLASHLRESHIAVNPGGGKQGHHNAASGCVKQICGAVHRQAQSTSGRNTLHMRPQAGMRVPGRAPVGRGVGVGVHEQVELRMRKTERNVPCPTVTKELDGVFGGVWRALLREVQGKAVVGHGVQQTALVVKKAIQNGRLYPSSLGHSARRDRILASLGEQRKGCLKNAFTVRRSRRLAQSCILPWRSLLSFRRLAHRTILALLPLKTIKW